MQVWLHEVEARFASATLFRSLIQSYDGTPIIATNQPMAWERIWLMETAWKHFLNVYIYTYMYRRVYILVCVCKWVGVIICVCCLSHLSDNRCRFAYVTITEHTRISLYMCLSSSLLDIQPCFFFSKVTVT